MTVTTVPDEGCRLIIANDGLFSAVKREAIRRVACTHARPEGAAGAAAPPSLPTFHLFAGRMTFFCRTCGLSLRVRPHRSCTRAQRGPSEWAYGGHRCDRR